GMERAQVTAGGVPLEEVVQDSMESKKEKQLYLLGELLDVDGICGGYNLHFAWSTAMIAAKHILQLRKENEK
ncbi:MAG: NAD(P)/FAD-dependent oxidoreductase, partial [Clostridium sp.]